MNIISVVSQKQETRHRSRKKNSSYRNIKADTVCRLEDWDGYFWFANVSFVLLLLRHVHSLKELSPPNHGDRGEPCQTPATLPRKASASGQPGGPCRAQKPELLPAN